MSSIKLVAQQNHLLHIWNGNYDERDIARWKKVSSYLPRLESQFGNDRQDLEEVLDIFDDLFFQGQIKHYVKILLTKDSCTQLTLDPLMDKIEICIGVRDTTQTLLNKMCEVFLVTNDEPATDKKRLTDLQELIEFAANQKLTGLGR